MLKGLLEMAVEYGASDLHIGVGVPPIFRVSGRLVEANEVAFSEKDTEDFFVSISTEEQQRRFKTYGEVDFSYSIAGVSRFRVNAFRQRGTLAIAIRIICKDVPSLESLGFPEVVRDLACRRNGLVLVTGPTGSGKSTTLAAMVDLINREKACHILTLEDPIEYLHERKKALIRQREIHTDTSSFAVGLRAALREDPDVLLVGEMRDAETMATAITAAETGHLVLATLHTGSAAMAIDRIIDTFPAEQQQQIRIQLSFVLQGVIAQQLVPVVSGASSVGCDGVSWVERSGRVAALEVLIATPAVRNLIRDGKTHQLGSVIQTGGAEGMQLMDMSLKDLYKKGVVNYMEAISRVTDEVGFNRFVGV